MSKGEIIRGKREELHISQTDLAKKCGVSKQTLYKYEKDIITNIPSDVIERLAAYLKCTPAYIMGWDETKSTYTLGNASLVALIRNDAELTEALKIYFSLPEDKKKYVINLIQMLAH